MCVCCHSLRLALLKISQHVSESYTVVFEVIYKLNISLNLNKLKEIVYQEKIIPKRQYI